MEGGGGALGYGVGEVEADGVGAGEALGFERLIFCVGGLGELQAVVELEACVGKVFECGEGDVGVAVRRLTAGSRSAEMT